MHLMGEQRGPEQMHPLSDEDDIADADADAIVTRYIHGIHRDTYIQDNNVTMTRLSFAALSNCLTISWQEQKCLQLIIWFYVD